MAQVYCNMYDPHSGFLFYYNTCTGESSWTKPLVAAMRGMDLELTPRTAAVVMQAHAPAGARAPQHHASLYRTALLCLCTTPLCSTPLYPRTSLHNTVLHRATILCFPTIARAVGFVEWFTYLKQ